MTVTYGTKEASEGTHLSARRYLSCVWTSVNWSARVTCEHAGRRVRYGTVASGIDIELSYSFPPDFHLRITCGGSGCSLESLWKDPGIAESSTTNAPDPFVLTVPLSGVANSACSSDPQGIALPEKLLLLSAGDGASHSAVNPSGTGSSLPLNMLCLFGASEKNPGSLAMLVNDTLISGMVLGGALAAVYLLTSNNEKKLERHRNRRPMTDEVDMDSSRNPKFAFRAEPEPRPEVDPLDFTPDLRASLDRLHDEIAPRTGNVGAVINIERLARKFAMAAYRSLGRRQGATSRLDTFRAADDMAALRADLINAVQALYINVHRDRLQLVLDEVTDALMSDTDGYIRAVRKKLGHRNTYEGGRGFPSAWREDADPAYDLVV
nr:hypothetical protein TetV2_00193 [Oceanusvirus sp.]